MKLSQALLGAVLVGMVAQTTTSCKKDNPGPKSEQGTLKGKKTPVPGDNCPACGLG
ncbi:chryseobasin-related MNIO class RiPP peptide [Hymenobacter lucidus]|uniref:Uncharacterized protein n=1 Tax=Hymenobacter lucidus TaxID=2880930 RepID=A0ABS8AUV4_9BACT|nr:hypothetical protein [Hymenobacter lucidus]MCB2408827.1 hypothetical protein [Hymenobacter lucidus]